ncbi:hypothetical protein GCM10025876_04280 [Demequina litorisediminis]|uniref:EAL domain-containing protein n=1 Tax=Demequina litorisediminis TaxID=1849022 RepID=A0ABQ6I8V1_9MICO|nr:hypothetical protein GCM10025876_04280 [Demequina litorisediminis]
MALREGHLEVHYQPVVDMATRRPIAYEALVRWRHPERGLLLPAEFIEVCEEANLVIPLGEFVLHEACRFIAARPGFTGKVLVNVSTRQIGPADLSGVVTRAIEAHGIDPARLALEITESGMLVATQTAVADLRGLTDMGIALLLDDFGTGYSALSSVLRSPVSGLKLAREFTLRLGDKSTGDRISTAVASLVDSLEMDGIIEGVETEAQYRQALAHGWRLAQGYLFGHPQPEHLIPGARGATPDARHTRRLVYRSARPLQPLPLAPWRSFLPLLRSSLSPSSGPGAASARARRGHARRQRGGPIQETSPARRACRTRRLLTATRTPARSCGHGSRSRRITRAARTVRSCSSAATASGCWGSCSLAKTTRAMRRKRRGTGADGWISAPDRGTVSAAPARCDSTESCVLTPLGCGARALSLTGLDSTPSSVKRKSAKAGRIVVRV